MILHSHSSFLALLATATPKPSILTSHPHPTAADTNTMTKFSTMAAVEPEIMNPPSSRADSAVLEWIPGAEDNTYGQPKPNSKPNSRRSTRCVVVVEIQSSAP